jgi:hypothetical protein
LGINLIEDQVYTLTDRYAEEIVDSKDIGMVMGDDVEDSASESNGKLHVIRPDDSDSDNDGPLPYVPGAASAMVEGDSDDEGPLPYVPGSASANVIEGSEYVPPNGIKKFKVPMNLYNIEKEKPPFNFQEYKKFEPPGSHFVFGNPQVPPPIRIEAGGDIIRKTKKPKYMKKNTKHTRKLKPKQTLKRRHPTKNKTKQNLKKQSRTMKKTRTQ